MVSVAFDVIKDIVGSVLSFLALFENFKIYKLLVLLINLIEALWVEDVVELKHLLCFG